MTVKDLTKGASPVTMFYVSLRQGDDIEEYDKGHAKELDPYTLSAPVLYYRAAGKDMIDVTIF
jgi:hypothetical protein